MIRDLALRVAVPPAGVEGFVEARIDQAIARERLEARDAALLRSIVCGAVRHRGSLDSVLRAYTRNGTLPDDRRVLESLRQAAFQLLFLDRVPDHAVVHETVALVRKFRAPVAGFANAVLRAVARESRVEPALDEGAGFGRAVMAPLSADDRFRMSRPDGARVVFERAVFPDPTAEPIAWMSRAFSLPEWLVARWLDRFGEERSRELFRVVSRPARVTLRVRGASGSGEGPSSFRDERDAVVERFRAAGIECEAGSRDDSLRLASPGAIDRLPGFAEGRLAVQGEAAMGVVGLVDVHPGHRVLDVASAPGGKSVALADAGAARVVSIDVSRRRVSTLARNVRRYRVAAVAPIVADGRVLPFRLGETFDRVLVDAPCSNTGVLAKRVEARWRIGDRTLRSLVELQAALLEAAAKRVSPGGRIVYSTCSLEPEENEVLAASVLPELGFRLHDERTWVPGERQDDGGYASSWIRDDG